MAVRRSVFDIEIRDDAFNAFLKRYAQYEKSLKSMPAAWKAVTAKIDGTRSSFDKQVDKMVAANVQAKLIEKAQERADNITKTTAERWTSIARSTKSAAVNIAGATTQLLRWSALTGLVSGLLGAGGLFGIDRMALGVASGRRASMGLGAGYGERRAFQANFGRLVDPESLLGGVSTALAGNRTALFGAGLTGGQLGGGAAQVSVEVLKSVKRLVDRTDESQLGFLAQARRLGELGLGVEELRRIKRTSPEEFAGLIRQYGVNRGQFDLPADVSRKWQEFTTQMGRAGQGIENTFVRGLAPLAPGFTKLSEAFEKVVRAFLVTGGPLEKWIGGASKVLERFAEYVGTPEFSKNVADFVSGVGKIASALGTAVKWIVGLLPAGATTGGVLGEKEGHDTWNDIVSGSRALRERRASGAETIGGQLGRAFNNPGNLRVPGQTTGFAAYASPEAGIQAMARQLQLYARRDRLDTIQGIVSKYAPPSENDTRAYIGDVSRKTGFAAGQHLNLGDPATLSALIAAMVSHEQSRGHYDKFKDAKVVVEVLNNTGGNATVSVNGMKN